MTLVVDKYVAYVPLADQSATGPNPGGMGNPYQDVGCWDMFTVTKQWMETLYTTAGFRHFLIWNPFGLWQGGAQNWTMKTAVNGITGITYNGLIQAIEHLAVPAAVLSFDGR